MYFHFYRPPYWIFQSGRLLFANNDIFNRKKHVCRSTIIVKLYFRCGAHLPRVYNEPSNSKYRKIWTLSFFFFFCLAVKINEKCRVGRRAVEFDTPCKGGNFFCFFFFHSPFCFVFPIRSPSRERTLTRRNPFWKLNGKSHRTRLNLFRYFRKTFYLELAVIWDSERRNGPIGFTNCIYLCFLARTVFVRRGAGIRREFNTANFSDD